MSPTLAVTESGENLWSSCGSLSDDFQISSGVWVHTAPTDISMIWDFGVPVEDEPDEVAVDEPVAVVPVESWAFTPATRATAAADRRYDVNIVVVLLPLPLPKAGGFAAIQTVCQTALRGGEKQKKGDPGA